MPPSARSPEMVGRRDDLAELRQAHLTSLSGAPRGVVVAGEAGIGKTRLIEEFLADLGEDVVVALGQCVDSGSLGTPVAPIRGVLRDLLDRLGTDAVLQAAGPAGHLLSVLAPELSPTGRTSLEVAQEQLHDIFARLLGELSQQHPLVLIVEDLHWADLATLDLLRSLLAWMRVGRITLVLTYRTDDVPRHHPLRPVLAELGRARDVSRVDLRRLCRAELADLARLHGRRLEATSLDTLTERSEGVPFFVEELLALDNLDEAELPETLRDLVLTRYDRLDERTQAVLRLLATGGVSVPHSLVELVHLGDPVELETSLRQAVDAHVLTADETAYTFRHALTKEAVEGELLPGERVRFHARYAAAMESHPDLAGRPAELAQHHLAAHDLPRAFAALVEAARQSAAGAAPASAGRLGEQALELWSRVPEAETLAGCSKPELALATAQAYFGAGDERAIAILEEGLAECPAEDRRSRALLLHLSMQVWHDHARPGGQHLLEEALATIAEGHDERDRAVRLRVLVGYGNLLIRAGDEQGGGTRVLEEVVREGRALRSVALDPAVRADAISELARALTNLGTNYSYAGDVDAGFAAFEEALEVGAADGHAELRDANQRGWLLYELGRYEEAAQVSRAGHAAARATGEEAGWGLPILLTALHADIALGRLVEAQSMLEMMASPRSRSGFVPAYLAKARAELLLHQDDAAGAATVLADHRAILDSAAAEDLTDLMSVVLTDAQVALAAGDLARAWSVASILLEQDPVLPGASYAVAATAAAVLGEMRRVGGPLEPDTVVLEKLLRGKFATIPRWDTADLWAALVEAELSGPEGTGTDVSAWEAAVDATATGRMPVAVRAHALTRLGQAQVDAGDRVGAVRTLEEAAELARRTGLLRAGRRVAELVVRAGLEPRTRRADGGVELTDRERQVLALVAEGLTNRQIGERLFISDKTASVHVSAILRKLGVGRRAEAAAHAASVLHPV